MSVGMVPLPVLPVKAPSPNCCPSPSKPFACHSYGKSLESSASSKTTAIHFDSLLGCANSFALNPLQNHGGEGGSLAFPIFQALSTFRIRRTIPRNRSLPPEKPALLYWNLNVSPRP